MIDDIARRRFAAGFVLRQWRLGVMVLALAAAGSAPLAAEPAASSAQKYPDVLSVKVQPRAGDKFDFDVTVSSPYDSPARYADAFRVMGQDGKVFGVRELLHDHAGEQPFTRELYGVAIPAGVQAVTVQGRDRKHGWGGTARPRTPLFAMRLNKVSSRRRCGALPNTWRAST